MGALLMVEGRSTFVTVTGWFFVAVGGFLALTALMQAALFSFISNDHFKAQVGQMAGRGFPPYAVYVYQHMAAYGLAIFVASCITVVAAVGLLRRANWARRLFMAVMVAGIVASILVPVAMADMMLSFSRRAVPNLPAASLAFDAFIVVYVGAHAVGAVAGVLLYGWIIKRLASPPIRREFGVA